MSTPKPPAAIERRLLREVEALTDLGFAEQGLAAELRRQFRQERALEILPSEQLAADESARIAAENDARSAEARADRLLAERLKGKAG